MIAGVDNSVHHTMKLMIQNQTFSPLLCFIFSSLTLTYGLSSILFSYVRIFDSCALCENFSRSVIQLTATPTTRIRKRRYARRSFFSCGLISLHLPTMPLRYQTIFQMRSSSSPKISFIYLLSVSLPIQQRVSQLGQRTRLGSFNYFINFCCSSRWWVTKRRLLVVTLLSHVSFAVAYVVGIWLYSFPCISKFSLKLLLSLLALFLCNLFGVTSSPSMLTTGSRSSPLLNALLLSSETKTSSRLGKRFSSSSIG